MPTKPKVIAFDIIETVFSLESMRERLGWLGLPPSALETWFATGLRDAFALAVTDRFAPFRSVLEGALSDILAKHGLAFDREKAAQVLDGMKELQPHPDAAETFRLLSSAGFHLVALSNGASSSTEALLSNGGLNGFVERVFSVEDMKLSKPRREVYLHVAQTLNIEPEELTLVATHAWDTHGAKAAGLLAAFVARGQPYPAVMLPPDIEGQELIDVAHAFVNLR
jgi:2-haloacid dehalogenase